MITWIFEHFTLHFHFTIVMRKTLCRGIKKIKPATDLKHLLWQKTIIILFKYSLFLFPLVLEHAIPSFFYSFYTTPTSECVKSKINIKKRRLFINLIESKCGYINLLELIYNQFFMKVLWKRISYILKYLFFS